MPYRKLSLALNNLLLLLGLGLLRLLGRAGDPSFLGYLQH